MKAFASLLAVLLTLSSTSLAQTAPTQTEPAQPTAPVQQTEPTQPAAQAQTAEPAQQTAAPSEASKPEGAGQEASRQVATAASPAAAAPSTETAAACTDVAPIVVHDFPSAAPFGPGAKIFLDPMNGFGELMSDALTEKKVPVIVVKDRADADYVMSGEAHVKTPNYGLGAVLSKRGGANVAIQDARTGKEVFACNLHRVDEGERPGDILIGWAGQCAGHLKKALKQK
jgi:hypothetical protein